MSEVKLNARQLMFCQEYLFDMNATQAAIRAGYSAKTAGAIGHENLKKPEIKAEIDRLVAERAARIGITTDMVANRWLLLATADPRKLVEHRRTCCRFCHGIGHHYQWKSKEEYEHQYRLDYDNAITRATRDAKRLKETDGEDAKDEGALLDEYLLNLPSDKGGFGYNPTLAPHPECPKCFGEGTGQVHINDTRDLDPQTALLFAGIKTTKDGVEIKMHDQMAALENLAKHLGMFVERNLTLTEDPLTQLLKQIDGSSSGLPKRNG